MFTHKIMLVECKTAATEKENLNYSNTTVSITLTSQKFNYI